MMMKAIIAIAVVSTLPCLAQQATEATTTKTIAPHSAVATPSSNPQKVDKAATAAAAASTSTTNTTKTVASTSAVVDNIDLNTATIMQVKCWSPFSIRVPEPTVRMVPQMDHDSYIFQFVDSNNKILMTIYSGHNLTIASKGEPCTATIAGSKVEGSSYERSVDDRGHEFILLVGKEGAALHIIVPATSHARLMYYMLASMQIAEAKPVSDNTKAYAAYVHKDISTLMSECVRIFSTVTDRRTADAAAPHVRAIMSVLETKHEAMDSLITRSGRSLLPYLQTLEQDLSPEDEEVIRRLHEVDCYGSTALNELLLEFLGM